MSGGIRGSGGVNASPEFSEKRYIINKKRVLNARNCKASHENHFNKQFKNNKKTTYASVGTIDNPCR